MRKRVQGRWNPVSLNRGDLGLLKSMGKHQGADIVRHG